MAINDHPDVRCEELRHPSSQEPPAAGILRTPGQEWIVLCHPCIHDHKADLLVSYDVVYLDPARQRRPNPDQPACTHDHDPTDVAYWADGVCTYVAP